MNNWFKDRKILIFTLMLFQTIIAISVGLCSLHVYSYKSFPGVYLGDIDISRMSIEQVNKVIDNVFGEGLKNNYLTIKYLENKELKIKYSDINAKINYGETHKVILKYKNDGTVSRLIEGYFSVHKKHVYPVIVFDESVLLSKLNVLFSEINKNPIDADIELQRERIIKYSHQVGYKFNRKNALSKINNEISSSVSQKIEFKQSNNYEIETIYPKITLNYFEDAKSIISKSSAKVESSEYESASFASYAINKVLVVPFHKRGDKVFGEFSFNKYIKKSDGLLDENDEGYNKVVTTLYRALKQAGIKDSDIIDFNKDEEKDDIKYEKFLKVRGTSLDFKFKNSLKSTAIIFTDIRKNNLDVYIIGKK